MSIQKIAAIKAPTNYYLDKQTGKQAKFYKTIGSLMEDDNGNQFLLMDKTFNLLATLHDESKGSVCLPLSFDEQNRGGDTPTSVKAKSKRPTKQAIANAKKLLETTKSDPLPFDDEIDF